MYFYELSVQSRTHFFLITFESFKQLWYQHLLTLYARLCLFFSFCLIVGWLFVCCIKKQRGNHDSGTMFLQRILWSGCFKQQDWKMRQGFKQNVVFHDGSLAFFECAFSV